MTSNHRSGQPRPGIFVEDAAGFLFVGRRATDIRRLYHQHLHVARRMHIFPTDIQEQTRRAFANIQMVLDAKVLDLAPRRQIDQVSH